MDDMNADEHQISPVFSQNNQRGFCLIPGGENRMLPFTREHPASIGVGGDGLNLHKKTILSLKKLILGIFFLKK